MTLSDRIADYGLQPLGYGLAGGIGLTFESGRVILISEIVTKSPIS